MTGPAHAVRSGDPVDSELRSTGLGDRLLRAAGGVVMAGHGVIHLMGVALLWRLAQPGELRYADARPEPGTAAGLAVGALWLIAAVLFVVAAALLVGRRRWWRRVAVVAAAVSLPVLAPLASFAAAGLVVDTGVLLAVLVAARRERRALPTA